MRTSIKRRIAVLAAAVTVCVAIGAAVAMPAAAHVITGIDATCDAVTVHLRSFPDAPVPVTFVITVGSSAQITQITDVRATQNVTVDITSAASQLHGATAGVDIDVTWLHGTNHEHDTRGITCGTSPDHGHKVTICHRTGSRSNPYVTINPGVAGILNGHGHDGHNGPVFSANLPAHVKWGDIIPPFDFGPGAQYAGKNWDASGQAIWNNGCNGPGSTTTSSSTTSTSSTTTSTSSTTSTSTSSTTTTTRPHSTTTTTRPHSTTTTTHPRTTTTTTTTQPTTGKTGDLFEVDLWRCSQLHTGYRSFPGGTNVRWKVIENDITVSKGGFVASSGNNYHWLTQPLGTQLHASPSKADVHYFWKIGGVSYSYFVSRAPGCSGTSRLGVSGSGNLFSVTLPDCNKLRVGYQYFQHPTRVMWVVRQYEKRNIGYMTLQPGNQFHFLTRSIGMRLHSGTKAMITFYWRTGITHWHYTTVRRPSC